MDYKEKYLKYKFKYLDLKELKGGSNRRNNPVRVRSNNSISRSIRNIVYYCYNYMNDLFNRDPQIIRDSDGRKITFDDGANIINETSNYNCYDRGYQAMYNGDFISVNDPYFISEMSKDFTSIYFLQHYRDNNRSNECALEGAEIDSAGATFSFIPIGSISDDAEDEIDIIKDKIPQCHTLKTSKNGHGHDLFDIITYKDPFGIFLTIPITVYTDDADNPQFTRRNLCIRDEYLKYL
jgi:hypothetical protein